MRKPQGGNLRNAYRDLRELMEVVEREGMEPDDLLCSRNARLKKALVGRAQWKINQPPSLRR
jgi:hypothetical protein